jgi:hypothetical protein
MAVPVRSDFYAIAQLPEVYHGGEISKAAFFGVQHPVFRDGIKHNIWGVASAEKRQ